MKSIQPLWCLELPLQQQSVLLLASRGPDGVGKDHPCKDVQRAYRATVFVAARRGRLLHWGEKDDVFMGLDLFGDNEKWSQVCDLFFASVDSLPHHYYTHFMYGAEILGYQHPDPRFRDRWESFYKRGIEELHFFPESKIQMELRLNDWNKKDW